MNRKLYKRPSIKTSSSYVAAASGGCPKCSTSYCGIGYRCKGTKGS